MNPTHLATTPDKKGPARGAVAALRLGLIALVCMVGGGLGAAGCLERPLCDKDCRPATTNIFVRTISQTQVDKIDMLFMIDNSISMADKQTVLKAAVPDLANRLVNPICVNPDGTRIAGQQPAPGQACPSGAREFQPITNIHIGVITSSLGGHGSAKTCFGADGASIKAEMVNDHGRLVTSRPRWPATLARYPGAQPAEAAGFLDWNPNNGHGDLNAFNATFQAMTEASGEFGCGFEASLESIFRFLVDPEPYAAVVTRPCSATNQNPCGFPEGKDDLLLAQRAAFLRPDSLVAVILLSDENDCSIRNSQSYTWAAGEEYILRQGSQQCVQNPNDPCCYSCLQASPPPNCAPDPACGAQDPNVDAQVNLRCFEQKRRYGLDFLYPTARYVNALGSTQLCRSRTDLDPLQCPEADLFLNPLFASTTGGVPRAPSLVFFAGIVGVPWQDLKATTIKNLDGVDVPVPDTELRYKTVPIMLGDGTFSKILGEPTPEPPGSPPIPPSDGLMVESVAPRGGSGPAGPLPGESGTLQPSSAGLMANPANGHEWNNSFLDDLQYACIFPLAPGQERDCAAIRAQRLDPEPGCDCFPGTETENNPLCQQPNGSYGAVQRYAKAYPGLRHLKVLRDFGNNSIVASICARDLENLNDQDYGYRPAVDAIVDRLKEALTGGCLPRKLEPDENGEIPCSVLEAVAGGGACDGATGRRDATSKVLGPARARLKQSGVCGGAGQVGCETFSICEIAPAQNYDVCLQNVPYQGVPGWCYVDEEERIGDPSLLRKCKPTERRILRFVDEQNRTPAPNSVVLVACYGQSLDDSLGTGGPPAGGTGGSPPVTVGDAAVP